MTILGYDLRMNSNPDDPNFPNIIVLILFAMKILRSTKFHMENIKGRPISMDYETCGHGHSL